MGTSTFLSSSQTGHLFMGKSSMEDNNSYNIAIGVMEKMLSTPKEWTLVLVLIILRLSVFLSFCIIRREATSHEGWIFWEFWRGKSDTAYGLPRGPWQGQGQGIKTSLHGTLWTRSCKREAAGWFRLVFYVSGMPLIHCMWLLFVMLVTMRLTNLKVGCVKQISYSITLLVKMLEGEPDFKNQKPLLVEVVEAAGGKVLFGTKGRVQKN